MKRLTRLLAGPLVATLLLAGGCATTTPDGDRLYREGDWGAALSLYREELAAGRAVGDTAARYRYRIGLITSLSDGGYYDPHEARRTLESVVQLHTGSPWAQPAALLLDLQDERRRIGRELEGQRSRARYLQGEIARIDDEKVRAEVEVVDREERLETLAGQISRLRHDIQELELDLVRRQEELDRIKEIDLETPP